MTKKEIISELITAAHIKGNQVETVRKRMERKPKEMLEWSYARFQAKRLAAGYIIHVCTGIYNGSTNAITD